MMLPESAPPTVLSPLDWPTSIVCTPEPGILKSMTEEASVSWLAWVMARRRRPGLTLSRVLVPVKTAGTRRVSSTSGQTFN